MLDLGHRFRHNYSTRLYESNFIGLPVSRVQPMFCEFEIIFPVCYKHQGKHSNEQGEFG